MSVSMRLQGLVDFSGHFFRRTQDEVRDEIGGLARRRIERERAPCGTHRDPAIRFVVTFCEGDARLFEVRERELVA